MKKSTLALAFAGIMITGTAFAEPIVGNWTTGSGGKTKIAACGSSFCVSVTSGEFAGRQIGKFDKDGDRYRGRITDPQNDRTYRGTAWFEGAALKMRGSVLGIGRTDTWTRR
ncbi:MAG: DUF2147 domain-containing protein [Pseudomonadota bacterium]